MTSRLSTIIVGIAIMAGIGVALLTLGTASAGPAGIGYDTYLPLVRIDDTPIPPPTEAPTATLGDVPGDNIGCSGPFAESADGLFVLAFNLCSVTRIGGNYSPQPANRFWSQLAICSAQTGLL